MKQVSQGKTNTIWFHSYVESNKQNELTSKIEIDIDSRSTTMVGSYGVGGLSKKKKGLMDMTIVWWLCRWGGSIRGIDSNGKNTIKK